ncbi:MAG: hypothetical protein CL832_07615 [Crocinitomicaceae bacterium]|nr:hypothetical protein [Crocinitomicaceae bacterium]
MSFTFSESKEQGNKDGEWQSFYLIHSSGVEVCYLQKDGVNGMEQAFNLNSKNNFPSQDDVEFDSSNKLLVELVEFIDNNFDLF